MTLAESVQYGKQLAHSVVDVYRDVNGDEWVPLDQALAATAALVEENAKLAADHQALLAQLDAARDLSGKGVTPLKIRVDLRQSLLPDIESVSKTIDLAMVPFLTDEEISELSALGWTVNRR